jgi:hypothetical protein
MDSLRFGYYQLRIAIWYSSVHKESARFKKVQFGSFVKVLSYSIRNHETGALNLYTISVHDKPLMVWFSFTFTKLIQQSDFLCEVNHEKF